MNTLISVFNCIKEKCSPNQENRDIVHYTIDKPFIGGDECIICLGEYNQGQNISILSCGHRFHKPCIEYWFNYKRTCPLCDIIIKP